MTKTFARWLRRVGLPEQALVEATAEMAAGLVDADLGGHVLKKRVALPGRGKRGGARVLIATKLQDRWFFLFGFGKNERDDLAECELGALKLVAHRLLSFDATELTTECERGALREICHETKPRTH